MRGCAGLVLTPPPTILGVIRASPSYAARERLVLGPGPAKAIAMATQDEIDAVYGACMSSGEG